MKDILAPVLQCLSILFLSIAIIFNVFDIAELRQQIKEIEEKIDEPNNISQRQR